MILYYLESHFLQIIGVLFLISFLIALSKSKEFDMLSPLSGHWHQHFFDKQFSTQEFYEAIQKVLTEQEIPNIIVTRVSHLEYGLLSSKREYLRVARRSHAFDICVAPFGMGTFVSYWTGEKVDPVKAFLLHFPVIKWIFKKKQTYHQLDTQMIFNESIHQIILGIVFQMSEGKGRRLDFNEMQKIQRIGKSVVQ